MLVMKFFYLKELTFSLVMFLDERNKIVLALDSCSVMCAMYIFVFFQNSRIFP